MLKSLAEMGLPMAEVKHFLHPRSDVFRLLASSVPDYFARMELEQLTQLKPKDAADQLQSTANRFRGFLDNPVTEATLGIADPELCVNVREMLDERSIVIIDLEPRDVLRDEDVQILANLWLAEWLHEVLSRPQERRVPSAIFCDELPVFRPSFKLIERCLRVVRKTLTRIFGFHQGVHGFPERDSDPLLRNLVGQTGIKAIFGHVDPVDANFFGEILALPNLDPLLERFRHTEREQYQDGWQVWTLVDQTFVASYADMEGRGFSEGVDEAENWSWTLNRSNTQTLTNQVGASDSHAESKTETESSHEGVIEDQSLVAAAYRNASGSAKGSSAGTQDSTTNNRSTALADAAQQGASAGGGGARSRSRQDSGAWQHTNSSSHSISYRQQLVPIMRWREVLRIIEFLSFEDQIRMTASDVARQRTGQCFLYVSGIGVLQVQIPLAKDPFKRTPKTLAKRLQEFFANLQTLPQYHRAADVISFRQQLLENFTTELQRLSQQRPLAIGRSDGDLIIPVSTELLDADDRPAYSPEDYEGDF